MKIKQLEITGFRNFQKKIEIKDSDLNGPLIVLVGKNGSGKSTILEVVAHLLGPTNFNQLNNKNFAQGIDKDKGAKFFIKLEISNYELESLRKQLVTSQKQNQTTIDQTLNETFGQKQTFTLKVEIKYDDTNPNQKYKVSHNFDDGPENRTPYWFDAAKGQRLLCAYFGSLGNVTLDAFQGMQATQLLPVAGQFTNSQINIDNRTQKSDISINSILNSLAALSLWQEIKKTEALQQTLDIQNELERLNSIISPLKVDYSQPELEETGVFNFTLTNTDQSREYKVNSASSGEQQILALWAMLNVYDKHEFKPIFLLDEPDLSLHPDYIHRICDYLNEVFVGEAAGHCIIATHSADFVYKNPKNVYRVSKDLKSLDHLSNLEKRVELFESLGRPLELSYLVDKVVFVEGNIKNSDRLSDHFIYQKLIDPNKERIVFLPAGGNDQDGSKKSVLSKKDFIDYVLSELNLLNIEKIIALVDSDNEKSEHGLPTPYCNVENLFIIDKNVLEEAIKAVSNDTEFNLSKVKDLEIKDALKDNGKEALDKIDQYIKSNGYKQQYKENGGLKQIQLKILEKIVESSESILKKEVIDFFSEIKK